MKERKLAVPMIWGAWFGIAAGVIGTIAAVAGQLGPHSVYGYSAAGFVWGWSLAHLWNWLGRRRA